MLADAVEKATNTAAAIVLAAVFIAFLVIAFHRPIIAALAAVKQTWDEFFPKKKTDS